MGPHSPRYPSADRRLFLRDGLGEAFSREVPIPDPTLLVGEGVHLWIFRASFSWYPDLAASQQTKAPRDRARILSDCRGQSGFPSG